MLARWQFWTLTLFALAQAALVAANIVAFTVNRKAQLEVNQRGQQIQQAAEMEQLARNVALVLAQLAARTQDDQIRSMLRSLGISVTLNESGAGPGGDAKRP